LWGRWWPERVCVEFLGDKIQAGYDALERREAAGAAAIWLDAWSDVVRLCDLTGIDSIWAFDDRFPMYPSLLNWSQDPRLNERTPRLQVSLRGSPGRSGARIGRVGCYAGSPQSSQVGLELETIDVRPPEARRRRCFNPGAALAVGVAAH
jgi:hypothetical protein